MKMRSECELSNLIRLARGVARREGLNFADAEDVASTTILSYLEVATDVRHPTAWVFEVARRQAWSIRRRATVRRKFEEDQLHLSWAQRRHEEGSIERELDARFAFVSLAASERNVLVSRDVEGDSLKDIAEKTGMSVETVKRRIRRGRETFARALVGKSVRTNLHFSGFGLQAPLQLL